MVFLVRPLTVAGCGIRVAVAIAVAVGNVTLCSAVSGQAFIIPFVWCAQGQVDFDDIDKVWLDAELIYLKVQTWMIVSISMQRREMR